jgi:hypothetical protein
MIQLVSLHMIQWSQNETKSISIMPLSPCIVQVHALPASCCCCCCCSVACLCDEVHCSHRMRGQLMLCCPLCCAELCALLDVRLGQLHTFRLVTAVMVCTAGAAAATAAVDPWSQHLHVLTCTLCLGPKQRPCQRCCSIPTTSISNTPMHLLRTCSYIVII